MASLHCLAKICCIVQPQPIPSLSVYPEPTPRVIPYASPQRVNSNNVSHLRVPRTGPPSSVSPTNQEQLFNGRLLRTPSQHSYPIQKNIRARHVTTITSDNAQQPISQCPDTSITAKDDHYILYNRKTDIFTILPHVNHVICEDIGKS